MVSIFFFSEIVQYASSSSTFSVRMLRKWKKNSKRVEVLNARFLWFICPTEGSVTVCMS